ncbi:hypothetical protein ACEUZ9_004640 [Paracoccus litorisediminis]|uniref:hypothetical protein n=1 Tax=Paracoccus litorisediminis TaxID=2006130 RepID=UPI003731CA7C
MALVQIWLEFHDSLEISQLVNRKDLWISSYTHFNSRLIGWTLFAALLEKESAAKSHDMRAEILDPFDRNPQDENLAARAALDMFAPCFLEALSRAIPAMLKVAHAGQFKSAIQGKGEVAMIVSQRVFAVLMPDFPRLSRPMVLIEVPELGSCDSFTVHFG